MPELPEVETVVRDLRPELVGDRFREVRKGKKNLRRPWKNAFSDKITSTDIASIDRRGKWIHIRLRDSGYLIVHLGMTGQLQIQSADHPAPPHTHFIFEMADGQRELRFTDIRRFGSVQFFETLEEWVASVNEPLGPEPWDVTGDYWQTKLAKSKRSLKALLLDQGIVAGVGNIYADESLFHAGIHPTRIGSKLTKNRREKLRLAIIEILDRAIASRGSTIRNYVGGSGLKGGYQDSFFVYGRTDQPCLQCGKPIECTRLAGRSTHYCPKCQT